MNICKTCKNYTKSGICLYFRLKITDIFNDCNNYISSEQVAEIPKIDDKEKYQFCFLKHYCKHCGEEIPLKKSRLYFYEHGGYPKFLPGHQNKGKLRPDLSALNSEKMGSSNPMFEKDLWNKGTKGICKSNSGSFKKGQTPWNKGTKEISVELLKPEILQKIPKTRKPLFCYLPHYCGCPDHELMTLEERLFRRYERTGYPVYLPGHQMKGVKRPDMVEFLKNNNPMHDPEVVKKISILNSRPRPDRIGIPRPDMSKMWKENNPMWNPISLAKSVFTRFGIKITDKEISENPEITTIISNIETEIKVSEPIKCNIKSDIKPVSFEDQLKIALKRIEESRKNRVVEPEKVIKPKEDNTYSNRINDLLGTKEPEEIEEPKNVKIRRYVYCAVEGFRIEFKKCKKDCKFYPC